MAASITRREQYELLRASLESERTSFIADWRDLAGYILPRRPQFTLSDTHKGGRRNQKIVNSTGTLASRTLRAGMMGGVTSPARPWFKLGTQDPELGEYGPVKFWLHTVTERMRTAFLRSNLYNALPLVYGDIGTFATAAMAVEEDLNDVLRCYPFPIGSYMLATNNKNEVDVFFREFRYTVRQLVQKFGGAGQPGKPDLSRFSTTVRNYWARKQYNTLIDVCHIVQPNVDHNPQNPFSKRYESVYFEKGVRGSEPRYLGPLDEGLYLREGGHEFFPVLAPRWEVTGEDVYGTESPGFQAIGDVKALQILEKRKAQAIEKMVNPPLKGPPALKTQRVSLLPGDITYSVEREGQKGLGPIHEVKPQVQELLLDIERHERRISRAYYEDLFLMLATSDRRQITAREVEERHSEKLLALGPVLEQLNQDLLDPLIDIAYQIMDRQGLIPDPPEELEDQDLKVEYISIMHQAQKLAGLAAIERFTDFVGGVAQVKPEVLDKVDGDQLINEVAEITGVPPRVVLPDDQVAAIREQRAQQAEAERQTAMLKEGAGAARDLSQSGLQEDNVLKRLIDRSAAGA